MGIGAKIRNFGVRAAQSTFFRKKSLPLQLFAQKFVLYLPLPKIETAFKS
jgi:hypothetical protein